MRERNRTWIARHRGNLSLIVAGGGWLTLSAVSHYSAWHGPVLTVSRQVFEGAMIGGLADWFAVRALFRPIPIPLLRRHTNIISRNRPRLTEGIVDMVQNQWLAPTVIRERLRHVSLSRMAVAHLQGPAARRQFLTYARTLLTHIAANMDSPELVRFVGDLAARQLHSLDLNALILRPLIAGLRDDAVLNDVWRLLSDNLRKLLQDDEVRGLLYATLENLIERYLHEEQEKGVLSATWAKVKVWVGLPGKDEREAWFADKLERFDRYLLQQSEDPDLALRRTVRDKILGFLHQLESPDSDLARILGRQRDTLIESLSQSNIVQRLITSAKDNALKQLGDEDSALSDWLSGLLDDAIETVQSQPELQSRLDNAVSDLVVSLVEQNPDAIGATVRYALSPERLSDQALIRQIEDKVGGDLEWIRVNGAVVGGIVAGLLAVLHLWL